MSSEKPKVSILCTTYNQVDYIEDAINSFLNQKTDFPFEIIINDDASDDGTTQIIRLYEECYPDTIRIITHERNQYSQGVRNVFATQLLPLSRGDYIAFCEGDDYWTDESKLQIQIDAMEENLHASMCVTASINVRASDKKCLEISQPYTNKRILDAKDILSSIHTFATATYCIRRSALEAYAHSEIIDLPAHGDHKMSTFLFTVGPIIYLPAITAAYRVFAKGSINRNLLCSGNRPDLEKTLRTNRTELLDKIDELTQEKYHKEIGQGKNVIDYVYYASTYDYSALKKRWPEKYAAYPPLAKLKFHALHNRPRLIRLYNIVKNLTKFH